MAKVIKTAKLFREATLDRAGINKESRTVELSFSSESPVERWFGTEILDHSPESVDLSRLKSKGPLLMDHNTRDQVGVVENANITDKRGKAIVRFSRSARGEEVFQDVLDGIRTLVSVGYSIDKADETKREGKTTIRATHWTPMEISLVSVPADPTVGVGRAVDGETFETTINERILQNMDNTPNPAPTPAPAAPSGITTNQLPASMLKESFREMLAMADMWADEFPGIRELAAKGMMGDWPISRFREEAQRLVPNPKPVKPNPVPDLNERDLKYYSLSRTLGKLAMGKELDGFEKEISSDIAKRTGRTPSGFWVPPQALVDQNMLRSVNLAGTGAIGGFVVETDNLAEQFIEVLRNKAQVMRLGARVLNLNEPTTIPRQSSAGTANWAAAETTASSTTTVGLEQVTLSPKTLTAHFQYTKQLLITGNPSIDALIRDDITNILALAIDAAALQGTGSNGQPAGILATFDTANSIITSTNAVTASAFGTTFYLAAVSLETLLSNANADMGSLAYLVKPAHRGAMKVAQRFSSTDSPVWNTRMLAVGQQPSAGSDDGILNGYQAAVSNQIQANITVGTATTITSCIFFGNWQELLVGNFNGGAVDLVVDPYSLAANRIVRLIASQFVDIGLRHKLSFAALTGIL